MQEGDWVVCMKKFNDQGEPVRGYIRLFVGQNIAKLSTVNYGIITTLYADERELYLDDSRHPEDIRELIDWALADGDRIMFDQLVKHLEVVTDG